MSAYGGDYDPGYESYIDSLHTDIQEVMDERDQLRAENERLRELVRDVHYGLLGVLLRIRELGIEVDEWA